MQKLLNIHQDFTELLNLHDFAAQVEMLNIITANVEAYKNSLLLTNVMTLKQVASEISAKDLKKMQVIYFNESFSYMAPHYYDDTYGHHSMTDCVPVKCSIQDFKAMEESFDTIDEEDFENLKFLVDVKGKRLIHLHNFRPTHYTSKLNDNVIEFSSNYEDRVFHNSSYRRASWNIYLFNVVIHFDIASNDIVMIDYRANIDTTRTTTKW